MAQHCKTCSSRDKAAIEALIAGGTSLSAIERKFQMNRDALRRHRDRHMSAALTALRHEQADAVKIATTASERVESLVTKLEALVERTHDQNRESMLLQASRELRSAIELAAKLSGELRPESQTTVQVLNLQTDPSWIAARQAILNALRAHPEAMIDVVEALRRLDTPSTPAIPLSLGAVGGHEVGR